MIARASRLLSRALTFQIVGALAGVLVLWRAFHSIPEFVKTIDHGDGFDDFVHHYYPTVAEHLRSGPPAGGFFYPASFAALLAPLGLMSLDTAKVAWAIILVACTGVIAFWLVGVAALPDAPRRAHGGKTLAALGTAMTITSVPVLHDLKWGQVSLPIIAASGAAFVLHARGRSWLAAALLGIASGIKGYPLVFLVWFVLRGDFRFTLRALLCCAVTLVVLPAVVLGPSHALFVQRVSTGAVLGAAEGVVHDFNSQYAPAVFARYHGGWDAISEPLRSFSILGSTLSLAIIGLLTILAARSPTRAIAERREMLGFVLLASSVPFWLRTSWSHYFVHLPIAQILLTRMLLERGRPRDKLALLLFVAPSVYLSSLFGLFATEGWWYYANSGSLLFADVLVLFACAAVLIDEHVRSVFSSVLLRSPTATPQSSQSLSTNLLSRNRCGLFRLISFALCATCTRAALGRVPRFRTEAATARFA